MPKINLNTEPRFKALLKELGFSKKGDYFKREYGDAIQSLSFSHSTHNEKHVRYYNCLCYVDFPKIKEITEEIGYYTFGAYSPIGYLMPQKRFYEWRIAEDDTDDNYVDTIHNLLDALKKYIIPYMERYSTLLGFVDGVEHKAFYDGYDSHAIPVAYHLLGQDEKAIEYIREKLRKEERLLRGNLPEFEIIEGDGYRKEIYTSQNNGYTQYLDYIKKLDESLHLNWVSSFF